MALHPSLVRLRRLFVAAFAPLLAGLLVLWILGPEAPQSGPMLQQVTATSLLITRMDRSPRRVRVTVAPASLPYPPGAARVVTEDAPTWRHAVPITGLVPATRYGYRIEDLEENGRISRVDMGWFGTAPVDEAAPVRIVAVGDTGHLPWWSRNVGRCSGTRLRPLLEPLGGLGQQWELARCIDRQRPDLLLHLGDVVYPRGELDGYEDGLFRPFDQVLRSTPVIAAIGNHDVMAEVGAAFDLVFLRPTPAGAGALRFFTFAWGAVRIVVLDPVTAATAVDSPQGQFLERTLADATERWKVVAMHYPVFCSSRYSDSPTLIQDLWPRFVRHKVDLVLSGHSHDYQRFAPRDGVVQVIAGAGGHSVHAVLPDPRLVGSSERCGFLLLEIHGRRLTGVAKTKDGTPVDRFVLEK